MPPTAILNQDISQSFVIDPKHKRNLIYHNQYHCFYLWQGGWYKKLDKDSFNTLIFDYLLEKFPKKNITNNLIDNIRSQITYKVIERRDKTQDNYIALKDNYFNLDTFKLEKVDKSKFVTFNIPFTAKEIENTKTPNFTNFLNTSVVLEDDIKQPDTELIKLIQEMMGYFLLPEMEGASSFFLVGEGHNGKSKLCNVIQAIIGNNFCSAMSIETLTTQRFSTANLIDKKINISNEEESKFMKSDKFKTLVSGEMITAERKFSDNFEFTPKTKYLFASNRLPTFDSLNLGVKRRVKIIPFNRIFSLKERDHQLEKKLMTELAGIIRFAIEGAKKIMAQDFIFTNPEASKKALIEFENEISSAIRFIRENYDVDIDTNFGFISVDDLYNDYRRWCDDNGKKPINKISFSRDITNNIEGVVDSKQNDMRGKNLIKKSDSTLNNIDFND